jgi:anti-sigma-K factor RskA
MSDRPDISPDLPPDDQTLAAEYVLRLLDEAETRAFERRLADEPALRAMVSDWEEEFSALAKEVPEVAPPPRVKSGMLGKLTGRKPDRWWRTGWFAIPSAVALALVAFVLITPVLRGPAFEPTLHASLATTDGALVIEAGYSPNGSLFRVIREAGGPAPGRDLELWVIGEGADAPVSLGVIPADQQTTFEISPEIAALIDGGILAVSDEPVGGSPTGAPTGDILATGAFFDV